VRAGFGVSTTLGRLKPAPRISLGCEVNLTNEIDPITHRSHNSSDEKQEKMLNVISLREQVYHYLREEMHSGRLLPGSTINPNEISKKLGISKTPLRDALIRLETEGFVRILPRRGVKVNALTLQDVKDAYDLIGALEGWVINCVFDRLSSSHTSELESLNSKMIAAIHSDDFDDYYDLNLAFHDVYLALSSNMMLRHLITPIKQRLYDFPRRSYIKEWELRNCEEHQQFINMIQKGDRDEAVRIMRDVHWSFTVQEKYIREFFFLVRDQIRAERSLH
jgi:DNA-binding GntR family transcriptional regulator